MKYFSKNKKWMAYLILLTFLFTSIMPTNLVTGDSAAWAADYSATVAKGSTVTLDGSSDFPNKANFKSGSKDREFSYDSCTWNSSKPAVATVFSLFSV